MDAVGGVLPGSTHWRRGPSRCRVRDGECCKNHACSIGSDRGLAGAKTRGRSEAPRREKSFHSSSQEPASCKFSSACCALHSAALLASPRTAGNDSGCAADVSRRRSRCIKPGARSFSRSRALARQSRREVRNECLWPRAVVRSPLRAAAPGPPRRQVVPEHLCNYSLSIELQLAARRRLTLVDIVLLLQHDLAPSAASCRLLPLTRRRRRLERPGTAPTRTAEPLSSVGKRRRAAPPARDRAATAAF